MFRRCFSSVPSSKRDAVILSAVRTPTGSLLGSLSGLKTTELGSHAIQHAISRAGIIGDQVDEAYMGCVLQAGLGQAPARQAALRGGVTQSAPCTTVHKVCASGMKSVMLAAQSLWLGQGNVIVAGGMESMSNAPHMVNVRSGIKFGAGTMADHMQHDGLFDAFDKHAMGMCAEDTADKMNFSREDQDRYALQSFARTLEATEAGRFKDEIAEITIKSRRGEVTISEDEGFRSLKVDKVPTLRPAFKKDGSVTAANSSTINDGASALVLASREKAEEIGVRPLARVIGIADAAAAPIDFPTAPALAIPKALKMAGLKVEDIGFWEINEAFAVVVLANLKMLGVSEDICNVNGGAVSLGHPIGSSGSRIIVSLTHILQQKNARYGVAAICNGGGGASAIVIENENYSA